MALKLTNNAASRLASGITNSQTNVPLRSGDGALWPTLSGGDWCPSTLVDAAGHREIVRVTARTGDMLTVTRAQEGTSARAWAADDVIELRLTADTTQHLVEATAFQSALAGKADATHSHAQSDVTGLSTALSGKVPTGRIVATTGLLTGGGDLSADRSFAVAKASGAEIASGTEDAKAATPKAISDARGLGTFIPVGTIVPFAGAKAPAGWRFCDGTNISRTTYATLFDVLAPKFTANTTFLSAGLTSVSDNLQNLGLEGCVVEGAGIPNTPSETTVTAITLSTMTLSASATATASTVNLRIFPWGRGDGSTSFNLPDLRGVVAGGRDNMGGVAASRLTDAGTGNPGVKGRQLGFRGGADRQAITAAQMAPHTHGLGTQNIDQQGSGINVAFQGGSSFQTGNGADQLKGEAHPNVQPTTIVNHVIFTGVFS